MRADEFIKVDEAMPALAAVGRAVGGALGGIAKAGAKAGSAVAKKVGTKAMQGTIPAATKSTAQKAVQKASNKANQQMAQTLIKKGSSIPFPTQSGQAKEFEIDDVKGDEVTIINPDARNKPEEPEKMVYKKKDVETVIKGLQQ